MIARALLALGAYSPVAVLVGVRITRTTPSRALIGVGILAAACMIIAIVRGRFVSSKTPLTIVTIEDKAGDVPAYMMSYLLPFVTVADPTHRDLAVLIAFGVVLLIVSARSNVVTVNPLLILAGYHVYEAKVAAGTAARDTVALLARKRPLPVTDVDDPATYAPVSGRLVATGIYLIGK